MNAADTFFHTWLEQLGRMASINENIEEIPDEVFQKMELFKMLELPLLVGISRKSMIYKTLDIGIENALNGTTVLNTLALTKGANIIRVHDVKEAMECVTLFNKINL